MASVIKKNYIYHLVLDYAVLDVTSLNERNRKLAKELFFNEFGWGETLSDKKKARARIILDEITEEEVDE